MRNNRDNFIRSEVDDLILGNQDNSPIEYNEILIDPLDLADVSTTSLKKGKDLVLSCLKLYFSDGIISKNEFLQAKMNLNIANIGTIIKQIKIAEHFVDKIVARVDSGSMDFKMFEVATNLQRGIMEMLKSLQLHVISTQEEFRGIKHRLGDTVIEIEPNGPVEVKDQNTKKIYTNMKSLLKNIDEDDEIIDSEQNEEFPND